MSEQEETQRQAVDPTTPVLPDYPYHISAPTTPDPYSYPVYEIGVPPPPPQTDIPSVSPNTQKKPRRSLVIMGVSLAIALLLFASAGLFYLARTYAENKAQPTPIVRFVPVTATPTAGSTQQLAVPGATPTLQPTIDPNYTADEIFHDMVNAGCQSCGYGLTYGTTIWDYSGHNYFMRLSHIMLYVDGKSNLANPLVIPQASSYTENETADSAQVVSDKGVVYAVNEYPPDQGSALGSSLRKWNLGELSPWASHGD